MSQQPGGQKQRPAPSILDRYPGAKRKPVVVQEPGSSSSGTTLKMILAIVIMLVAGIAAIYVVKHLSGSKAAVTGPILGEDGRVLEMIDDYGIEELRAWLKYYDGRMVLGMTREQAFGMADRWYQMGAKNVYAFKGAVITMSVIVELPDDKNKRKAMFDWYSERWMTHENTAGADVGQKYLLLIMHP